MASLETLHTLHTLQTHRDRLQNEFKQEQIALSEILTEKNNVALDIYNKTISYNNSQFATIMAKLETKYNNLLKEVENIFESYNITLSQINSIHSTCSNIKSKLQQTLDSIPSPDRRCVVSHTHPINTPEYLYKFEISRTFSEIFIPYKLRPNKDGKYILTIKQTHFPFTCEVLNINSYVSKDKYYYVIVPELELLILYSELSERGDTYIYFMSTLTRNFTSMREYSIIKIVYYESKILCFFRAYNVGTYNCKIYTFDPKSADFSVDFTVDFLPTPPKIHNLLDWYYSEQYNTHFIIRYSRLKIYNKLYRNYTIYTINTIDNIRYEKIGIVDIDNEIITVGVIFSSSEVKYLHIHLSHSLIYKHLISHI